MAGRITQSVIAREMNRGHGVFSCGERAGAADVWADCRLRRLGGPPMNWAYVWSGIVALGLLVYLVYALLRAEEL